MREQEWLKLHACAREGRVVQVQQHDVSVEDGHLS